MRAALRSGGTASRMRLRRVSQRPRPAYSSTKQVAAVTRGNCQIVTSFSQTILVAGSRAAVSSREPIDQATPKRQAMASGRAAGT
jgi:hypothetical protein